MQPTGGILTLPIADTGSCVKNLLGEGLMRLRLEYVLLAA